MTYKSIVQNLTAKKFSPIYFLSGEESYYIDKIAAHIEQDVLDDSQKAFNQVIYYGKDIEFKQVVDAARQFPMMSPYRVVVIREAQHLRQIDALISYFENPSPQTILVFCYKKKLDGRKKFGKVVKDNSILFESKPLRDYQIEPWITEQIISRGYKLAGNASLLLSEYLGNDLAKINSELDKLLIDLGTSEPVTAELVRSKIGISKEYNVFELQKAIGTRDVQRANMIVRFFSMNKRKHPIQMINSFLYSYFSKLFITSSYSRLPDKELGAKMNLYNTYFLKEYRQAAKFYNPTQIKKIFAILLDFDGRSKGIDNKNTTESELIKEMVMKIVTVA